MQKFTDMTPYLRAYSKRIFLTESHRTATRDIWAFYAEVIRRARSRRLWLVDSCTMHMSAGSAVCHQPGIGANWVIRRIYGIRSGIYDSREISSITNFQSTQPPRRAASTTSWELRARTPRSDRSIPTHYETRRRCFASTQSDGKCVIDALREELGLPFFSPFFLFFSFLITVQRCLAIVSL